MPSLACPDAEKNLFPEPGAFDLPVPVAFATCMNPKNSPGA